MLYADWLQIWDARELELINEVQECQSDCERANFNFCSLHFVNLKVRECYSDSEWASSDRVVLAGSDGTVRLAGLALAATSRY